MSTLEVPLGPNIGTLLIGALFNTFLYGIVTNQYAASYRRLNHRGWIGLLLFFAYLLDTACSAMTIYIAWTFLIAHYNDIAETLFPVQPYEVFPAFTACSAFITQVFLAWRTWRLTRRRSLLVISAILAGANLALGMGCGIKSALCKIVGGESLLKVARWRTAWMVSQVAADFFITTALCTVLLNARTGMQRTDNIIHRLIRGAIHTGVIAAIFAICGLVSYLTWPGTNISGMFIFPTGRIYTITLFNSLLSREDAREELGIPHVSTRTRDYKGGGLSTTRNAQLTTAITITPPDLESHGAENSDNVVMEDVSVREGE